MLRLRNLVAGPMLALAAVASGAVLAPARAQEQCVLDRCVESRTAPGSRMRGPVAPADFDFYVLALSWSPGFCAVTATRRDSDQCEPGAGLGFVVHGLWPQRAFSAPSDCEAGLRPPSRHDIASVRDLFPSEGLARYQWRKHGGCSGLPASAYFADVRRAREAIAIPLEMSRLRAPDRVAPEEILRAFRDANPRLRPGMAAVSCPKNVFQEVRICMTKDLRGFTPCPGVVSRSCRAREIEIRPPL